MGMVADLLYLYLFCHHLHVFHSRGLRLHHLIPADLLELMAYIHYSCLTRTSIFWLSAFGAYEYPERGIRVRRTPVAVKVSPIRIRVEPRDSILSRMIKLNIVSLRIRLIY